MGLLCTVGDILPAIGGVRDYFYAPLRHTFNVAGATATFSRASVATYTDNNGYVVEVGTGEARFIGARRVDHSDGIDYGAGALGVEYLTTDSLGNPIPEYKLEGYLSEHEVTNHCLYNEDGTNAVWVDNANALTSTAAGGGSVIGIRGQAESMPRMIATGNDAQVKQTISGLASSFYCFSVYLLSSSELNGTVEITIDDGVTWTEVNCGVGNGPPNRHFVVTSAAVTSVVIGIRLSNSGDQVRFQGAQVEAGKVPTSVIFTTSAAATRAADRLYYTGVSLPANDFVFYSTIHPNWNNGWPRTSHHRLWGSGVTDNTIVARTSQSSRNFVAKHIVSGTDEEDVTQATSYTQHEKVNTGYRKSSVDGIHMVVTGVDDGHSVGGNGANATEDSPWGTELYIGYSEGAVIPVDAESEVWADSPMRDFRITPLVPVSVVQTETQESNYIALADNSGRLVTTNGFNILMASE